MISYTKALTFYQNLTEDDSAKNTALFDIVYNEKIRNILSSWKWSFLNKQETQATAASQQFYNLPYNFKKLNSLTVLVSATRYPPKEVKTREEWDLINATAGTESTIPQYYFIFDGQVGIYPTPTDTSGTITINYKIRVKDMGLADYTTGTITTAVNGSTTIVGSGTSWTAKMADRRIRITDSNTANTGDGEWYEIKSITDATHLVLKKKYEGISIVAGSATHTIGQISVLPEDYQMLPVYGAVFDYWAQQNDNRAIIYDTKYKEMLKDMKKMFSSQSDNPVLDEGIFNATPRRGDFFYITITS